MCPAGGAASLRLEQGGGALKGPASLEGNPHTLVYIPCPRVCPMPWSRPPASYTGLLCPPLRSPHALPNPYPFKRYLQPHRRLRRKAGISALTPAQLGLGTGWAMQAETSAFLGEGVGVSSLPRSG